MKVLRHILLLIVCFISSIFLCMQIFDDMLVRFVSSGISYLIMRVFLTIVLYSLVISIINKSISKMQIHIIAVLYIMCILCFTFFKGGYVGGSTGINVNPLEIINDFKMSSNAGLLLIGNIVSYIPIGIYIKSMFDIKNIGIYCGIILYCIIIESIQHIFKLGFFDINDIILNSFGYSIGAILYEKIKTIKLNGKMGEEYLKS